MVYTLSYSNIHDSEKVISGKRAIYLARASRKGVNPCLFFVVTGDCFKDFFSFNSFKEKVRNLTGASVSEGDFWTGLKILLNDSLFSDEIKRDIKDSYESLSISTSEASNILKNYDPRVNVCLSCNNDIGLEGVFLNIKGFDNLLDAIKSCWFHFFKKIGFNKLKQGKFDFSVGVIVEKFVSADCTVEVEISSDEKNLLLSVYKGLPEVSPGIVKDFYVLSFNHLEFINYELNSQNFSIMHQEKSGVLLKKRLGREGSDNKVSKKLVSDCARFTKHIFSVTEEFVKVYFVIKREMPYLFLINPPAEDSPAETDVEVSVAEKSFIENSVVDSERVVPGAVFVSDSGFVKNLDLNDVSLNDVDFKNVEDVDLSAETNDVLNNVEEVSEEVFFSDSDEFIIQNENHVDTDADLIVIENTATDSFSSFLELISVLEEDLAKMYVESFGFAPNSFEEAVYELDDKHGLGNSDKLVKVFEVKSMLKRGEEIDEDIVSSLIGIIEDFLKRGNA